MLNVRERTQTARVLAKRDTFRLVLVFLSSVALAALVGGVYWRVLPRPVRYQYVAANPLSGVLSYKGDTSRSGVYGYETTLTPRSVASGQLARAVSYPVDGQVYAQPLYVPGVHISGGTYNVVIVATEHDSVYAFDADQTSAAPAFWHVNLLPQGATTPQWDEVFPKDAVAIRPEIGITSTPVIDPSTHTLYVADMDKEPGKGFVQRLFAIDLATGLSRSVIVSGSVRGKGDGSRDGVVTFDARMELQRAALFLWHQRVYISYSSFGDKPPFHGWMFAYDAETLRQTAVLNTTPDGSDGGIWASGDAPAIGASTSLMYISVGNGTFDLNSGGRDAGDSVLALDPDLRIRDYFTPSDQAYLSKIDLDVGSAGISTATIQTSKGSIDVLFASAKNGHVWMLDQRHLGGYNAKTDRVLSSLPDWSVRGGMFITPTYLSDPASKSGFLYVTGLADYFKAYRIANGAISAKPVTESSQMFNYPGGTPIISWNGQATSSAIIWLLTPSTDSRTAANFVAPGRLLAYTPTDLSHPIYQSAAFPYIKFSVPTVAAGHIFVGTGDTLDIYSLPRTVS